MMVVVKTVLWVSIVVVVAVEVGPFPPVVVVTGACGGGVGAGVLGMGAGVRFPGSGRAAEGVGKGVGSAHPQGTWTVCTTLGHSDSAIYPSKPDTYKASHDTVG